MVDVNQKLLNSTPSVERPEDNVSEGTSLLVERGHVTLCSKTKVRKGPRAICYRVISGENIQVGLKVSRIVLIQPTRAAGKKMELDLHISFVCDLLV